MAMTSVMLPLGTSAPAFALRDVVSGRTYSLDSFAGKTALLVMFICRHCPYVVHVEQELAKIGRDYADTDGIIGISNDPEYRMTRRRSSNEWPSASLSFPFDETRDVKAYRAACLLSLRPG
jgi:peroxiredoxin